VRQCRTHDARATPFYPGQSECRPFSSDVGEVGGREEGRRTSSGIRLAVGGARKGSACRLPFAAPTRNATVRRPVLSERCAG
jgi:hypothetical protein